MHCSKNDGRIQYRLKLFPAYTSPDEDTPGFPPPSTELVTHGEPVFPASSAFLLARGPAFVFLADPATAEEEVRTKRTCRRQQSRSSGSKGTMLRVRTFAGYPTD